MFRITKIDDIAQRGADGLPIWAGVAVKAQVDGHTVAADGHGTERNGLTQNGEAAQRMVKGQAMNFTPLPSLAVGTEDVA